MPRIARIREGENLENLAGRLFEFADPAAGMKEAVDRLMEANRHLPLPKRRARTKPLEGGSLVVVPEVRGARHTGGSIPIRDATAGALLEQAIEGINLVGQRLEVARRAAEAELQHTIELANSAPLKAAARRDEALAATLGSVRKSARSRLKVVAEADVAQRGALDSARRTGEELVARFTGRSDD